MVQLGWEAGVVIGTLVVGLIIMAGDWVGPDFVFAGMIAVVTACRIITTKEATEGFASSGLLTVVILYVVAEGIGQTGGMEKALVHVLGRSRSPFWAQVRMFVPVMVASAFLNNTPIVALLIPIIIAWSRRSGVSPKKLLIPLSYAAVFGGTCTLIGTSTNLVISSLQAERYAGTPDEQFGFFDITPYGVPYAIAGMVYVLLFSRWLLVGDQTKRHSDLLFVARVKPDSPAVNNTVLGAGLKRLDRLFLVAVERQGMMTHAVGPDFLLQAEDRLHFCGEHKQAKLYTEKLDLQLLTDEGVLATAGSGELPLDVSKPGKDGSHEQLESANTFSAAQAHLLQATVRRRSPLVGRTIRSAELRAACRVAVLAVKRGAKRAPQPLSDVVLEPGDVLVLQAEDDSFVKSKTFKAAFTDIEVLDDTLEKEFSTGFHVTRAFSYAGKTVRDAGLWGIEALMLVGIDHADGTAVGDVGPDTLIELGDTLWFVGSIETNYFVSKITGLERTQARQLRKLNTDILDRQLVQAAVGGRSPLVGRTLREARFRNLYDGVVVAIHRAGSQISSDVRDVRLRSGDVLLLDAGSDFSHRHQHDKAFAVISHVKGTAPLKTRQMWWALFLGVAMVTTQIVGGALDEELINLFIAGILTAGIMLATRCLSAAQARDSIDWTVYVTIAFAFAFSTALENSNVAQGIADIFIDISEKVGGQTASFVSIYIATAVLSEIVSNNAAAALIYPVAARLGDALGVSPTKMSIVAMLGASAGFIVPYSYQTNLMVFAAGNYRFLEFARIGFPCQLWLIGAVIIIFALEDTIGVAVAIFFVALAVVLGVALAYAVLPAKLKARLPTWIAGKDAIPPNAAVADYKMVAATEKVDVGHGR